MILRSWLIIQVSARMSIFAGRMVYDDNGVEVFNFGKYKGMSVAEVLKKDPGYYSWILNSDFTLNTKAALTKIRLREMSNLITK